MKMLTLLPTSLRPALLGVLLLAAAPALRAAEITVSAASSLSSAFKALAPEFEARHPGTRLRLNFAASDALLAQISQGAPVDVFASADQETMDKAQARQLIQPGSRRDIAANSLVLISPAVDGLALTSLAELARPAVKRIALGRPEGVPAGRYAQRALQAAGLWQALEPKAVYAQNVRQALDYVARAEVEAGFVYATDAAAQADKVRVRLRVPTETAIRYPAALVLSPGVPADPGRAEGAAQFLAYLLSPAGQAQLAQHGFSKP